MICGVIRLLALTEKKVFDSLSCLAVYIYVRFEGFNLVASEITGESLHSITPVQECLSILGNGKFMILVAS